MPDPHFEDLILPANSRPQGLGELLSSLRRDSLSARNRYRSILRDAAFVGAAGRAYARPLVANERCGSWYVVPPGVAAASATAAAAVEERDGEDEETAALGDGRFGVGTGSAYFKSTDGHERAWKFSTRRLNLHVVRMVEENDGVIIVDSTRRGKRMPDALSTTVPIWCAVMNGYLLPSHPSSSSSSSPPELHLPPSHSPSTHAQISALLPSFLNSLRSLNLDSASLPRLTKPLRPFWVTPDSTLPDTSPPDEGEEAEEAEAEGESGSKSTSGMKPLIFQDYRPVICCTASATVSSDADYVQGAADDAENWARGLTPDVFWSHARELLAAPEDDQAALVARLLAEDKVRAAQGGGDRLTRLTPRISVCPLPLGDGDGTAAAATPAAAQIVLSAEAATPQDQWIKSARRIEVGLGKNKNASKNLRLALPKICDFVMKFLQKDGEDEKAQVVVACESGRDLSVGTALAISCYLFDDEGNFRVPDKTISFTKTLVKVRLGHIMTQYPAGNPSRNTLQSVNSFLMDWRN
ncbi:hypothetical protein N3K66_006887 [Trichothecium roseum]|uniref:Uncharacterized protein n=1 Tax=Trichothecium roseum TaxID=47278 RepID=A0ACC0UWN0_9HYPO|nr:hypothetical protein N3K66_006887 [Trichothecium roseum]